MNQLVLASSSPRRKALLEQVGLPFSIRKPNIDETTITTTNPIEKVKKLALMKARRTEILQPNEVILASDTVVSFHEKIFEKPHTYNEAFKTLAELSGNIHAVYTGVTIRTDTEEKSFVEKTEVEFWPLTDEEIDAYIQTNDPFDKAGAYGIQTAGAMFVKGIKGDYYNVVGLPLSKVVKVLRDFSITVNNN